MALILAALSTFSFLDRQVLALLVPDLARDLHVSDLKFGFLIGPAFILTYSIVLLPAALAVDRWHRVRLIAVGAIIWTVMTIASAFAQSYAQLLVLRVGVAAGEALLGPAAISLLGDLFARQDRPLPTATYIAGSVVGNTGSPMLSAAMLQFAILIAGAFPGMVLAAPWRLTLIGVAVPGLALAIILAVVGREPVRSDSMAMDAELESLKCHLGRRGGLYAGAFGGLGLLSMVGAALALWGPTYLIRNFGLSQINVGYLLGGVSLVSGLAGTFILPAIFRNRLRAGKIDQVPAIAIGAIALLVVGAGGGGYADSLAVALTGFGTALFVLMGVGTLPTLFIQLYTPSHLRGRISALLFFFIYLLATGVTPVVVPFLAGALTHSTAALGQAIGLISIVAGLASAAAFALIRMPLRNAEAEIAGQSVTGGQFPAER